MAISTIGGAGASSSAAGGNVGGLNVIASGWSSSGYYAITSPKRTMYALAHQDTNNSRVVFDFGGTANNGGTDFICLQGTTNSSSVNSVTLTSAPVAAAVYGQWDRKATPNSANGGIGYLNGTYFYGNTSGNIYSSPDLTTWTLRGTPVAANVRGFAFGNSVYCAVGFTSTTGMNATSTDGITWTNRTTSNLFTDVAFGAGKFFATVSTGVNGFYSTDGFTWTAQTVGGVVNSVAHNGLAVGSGSLFVAVGSGGVFSSPDGVTWTSRSNPSGAQMNSVVYGGGAWVAVGQTSNIITSTDGITWTSVGGTSLTAGTAATFNAVAYGGGRFFTNADYINSNSGYGGGYVSSNGITWRPAGACGNNSYPSQTMRSMVYGGGRFVAATGNSYISTSPDGLQGYGAGFTLLGLGSPVIN